ncbi:hypothetical protein HNP91_001824 [Methanococcus maripaludis]|uniref:Uncharacterized protein n=1 Tax=Methanococcus maripaludis TaxID=39152 RepID=A0A7J9PCM5_METMI|nr:hypothetical protein [Methanococcus maripaludis]
MRNEEFITHILRISSSRDIILLHGLTIGSEKPI